MAAWYDQREWSSPLILGSLSLSAHREPPWLTPIHPFLMFWHFSFLSISSSYESASVGWALIPYSKGNCLRWILGHREEQHIWQGQDFASERKVVWPHLTVCYLITYYENLLAFGHLLYHLSSPLETLVASGSDLAQVPGEMCWSTNELLRVASGWWSLVSK